MASSTVRKSLAMGPSVRNLLLQYKLEPGQVPSSGPHQTLIKSDVLNHVNKKNLEPNLRTSVPVATSATTHRQPPTRPQMGFTRMVSSPQTIAPNIKGTVTRISDKAKYPRKYPTQFEIDVINNGGCV